MKTLLSIFIVLSFNAMAGGSVPIEKLTQVENVYIPTGFDSNDRTEIIVSGILPNLCHKYPTSKVEVKGNEIKINVTALFYEKEDPFCPPMEIPYTEVINLGVMLQGDYKVIVNEKSEFKKESLLTVVEAKTDMPDEFAYALVDYVEKIPGSRMVNLRGYNPSDCYQLKEIAYISNGSDTYSILPKMEKIRAHCPIKMIQFAYEFEVPVELTREKILLHVRKMDGKSVNLIFDQ